MAQNKAALTQEVVGELFALASGQTASTDDVAFIESRIAGIVAALSSERIVTVSNIEAIPDNVFPDLVRVVAEECAPKFLRPINYEALAAAKARLVEITRRDRTASPLVLAVLDQLQIMGVTSPVLDATFITARLPYLLANLAQRNVIYIADVDTVEDDSHPAFHDLAVYVAGTIAPQLSGVADAAESRLRTLQRINKGTGGLLKTESALRPRRYVSVRLV